MKRKQFTAEQKAAAVARCQEGEAAAKVAAALGTRREVVYAWVLLARRAGGQTVFRKPGRPRGPKVAELLEENELLKQENERLKAQAAS